MPKPTPQYCKAELERMMIDCVNHAIGLREILSAERDALEHQDTTTLSKLAIDKEVCIGNLEQLETERAKQSVACGFGAGPEDMKALLAWCDEDDDVTNLWKHFLEVATRCNELNASNGSIIRLRRSQILDALAILRGGEHEPELYGPEGRESGVTTGRSLVQA